MEKVIFEADAMNRSLKRIAHEILEKNLDIEKVVLVGIKTRGVFLANRLSALIQQFEGVEVPAMELDVRAYRDDEKRDSEAKSGQSDVELEDKIVILVDDVLYTGRTIRAAMEAVLEYGRPKRMQLATLIDRGHRELPIRADYVGKNIPTSGKEKVSVFLSEVDGKDVIYITN